MLTDSTLDHDLRHVEMLTSYSLPASPRLIDASTRDPSMSTEQPFDAVTRKLREIGAIPIEDFLSSASQTRLIRAPATSLVRRDVVPTSSFTEGSRAAQISDPPKDENRVRETSPISVAPLSERNMNGGSEFRVPLARDNAISRLHQSCIRAYGSPDPLRYEYIEENGQKSKQCILTIALSDGRSRSYKSEAIFLRRADAKARVATLAIQMGALEFISEGTLKSSAALDSQLPAPSVGVVGTSDVESTEQTRALDPASPEYSIEKCLVSWRAGKVSAEWISYSDPRVVGQYGCALKIRLTDDSFRIVSCDSIHDSELDAKAACAQKAFDEGIIDYIKFGNGQTEPAQPVIEDLEPELFDQQRPSPKTRTRPMTLQAYYESLPQPFSESFGTKTAAEINAPSYINTLLQSARGGRLKYNFYWTTDKTTGLSGCLLRLERSDLTKSYFVDCLFQKRSDAKSAACLLALSQGLGDYIRSVKTSMDTNFTPEMRKLASEKFIFALNTECSKVRQGNRLNFTYSDDVDAFGASLEIDVSSNPAMPDTRNWTVPAEYRSKNDAKLAVCYHAVSQGAIEMIQFRGATPPPDRVSYWDVIHGKGSNPRAAKRKSAETEVVGEVRNQPKKRKKDGQKVESTAPGPINGGGTVSASQHPSSGTPAVSKRPSEKRPLNTRLQEINKCSGYESLGSPLDGRSPATINGGMLGLGDFPTPQTPYYPPPPLPGPPYPYHSHMGTPTSAPSPMYYQSPVSTSPVAFVTYHPHSTMPEQMIPHPPIYQPPFVPAYPQPPTVSPYYTMPSPYHSPYGYGSPPLYLPSTPDYRPDMYHHPLPHVPLHIMSPPSTPPRPQRVKRIDRNTALSPLKMAENLTELGELAIGDMKGQSKISGQDVVEARIGKERDKRSLEPGELTEGEGEEEEVSGRHQVLERRASMP